MIRTAIVVVVMIGIVIGLWYITQPMTYGIIKGAEDMTITVGANRTSSANMYTMLYFINDIWGPVVAVAFVVLLLILGQREDYRGAYQ